MLNFIGLLLKKSIEIVKRILSSTTRLYPRDTLSVFLFSVLTIIALSVALQQFYIINYNAVTRYSLVWHIPFNLFYFWYWFWIYPAILRIADRYEMGQASAMRWTLSYILIPLVMVLVHQVIASAAINAFLGYSDFFTLIYKRIVRNPWVGIDLVIYFTIFTAVRMVGYQRRMETTRIRVNQLHGQLSRSQLNALESQLHPHFLFNTLNTLSTLILKRDNVEAGRMLSLLQSFLRATIYGTERHEIPLREELRFVNQYLEIERVRFSDKLEVREEIDEETLAASVPTFLLQPIVENAIHHAIAPKSSKGTLRIAARKSADHLLILVEDDGPGLATFNRKDPKGGVGLKIVRERIIRLFGEDHVFEMGASTLGGLKVEIQIPFAELDADSLTGPERIALASI